MTCMTSQPVLSGTESKGASNWETGYGLRQVHHHELVMSLAFTRRKLCTLSVAPVEQHTLDSEWVELFQTCVDWTFAFMIDWGVIFSAVVGLVGWSRCPEVSELVLRFTAS